MYVYRFDLTNREGERRNTSLVREVREGIKRPLMHDEIEIIIG